jgi:hypothetical protein
MSRRTASGRRPTMPAYSATVRDASKPRSVGADGWRARLVSFSAREHSLPLSFWVPGSQAGISKGCSVARCRNLPKTSSVLADFLGQRFPRGGGRPDQSRDVRAFATSQAYANTHLPEELACLTGGGDDAGIGGPRRRAPRGTQESRALRRRALPPRGVDPRPPRIRGLKIGRSSRLSMHNRPIRVASQTFTDDVTFRTSS